MLGFPQFVQGINELLYISWSHHKSIRPCSSSLKAIDNYFQGREVTETHALIQTLLGIKRTKNTKDVNSDNNTNSV
jgi:hypothetical protein